MALEEIKTIKDAEQDAKQMIAEASAESKRTVANARVAGKAAVDAAVKKAEDELVVLVKKADEKATADAGELAVNTENKKAAMQARAEKRLEEAAALIVERIVNS